MPDRRPNATGFTLVEITVVLLLIAVVLAIVYPNLPGLFGGRGGGGVARQLTQALSEARAEAIATRQSVRFSLTADGRSWRFGAREGGGGAALALTGAPLAGGPAIVFFSDGGSTGGRITIDGGAGRRAVAIDWLTGRAAVTAE